MSGANTPRLDTDLLTLRSLVAIADTGSFSAAARRVGRTQSAVSLQVAKLEARLGRQLLDRTPRRALPTAAGEAFLAYARRILALADEAALAATAPADAPPLRVGFAEYLAPNHLGELLGRFRRAHAGATVELRLGTGPALGALLDEGALDLVVAGPDGGEGGETILSEPLVWVAPAEGGVAPGEAVPLVLMQPPCSYRKAALDALAAAGLAWRVTTEANAIQAVQSAVAAGLGVSVMARSAVSPGLRVDGTLPAVPETAMLARMPEGPPHPLAVRLVDFLRESLPALAPVRQAA